MYQVVIPLMEGIQPCSVRRLSDGASIPFDPDNTDYQEFLRWCSEGNEPLPPDEGESN